MKSSNPRRLPALFCGLLLALAALAPLFRLGARPAAGMGAAFAAAKPAAGTLTITDTLWLAPSGGGATQPVAGPSNLAYGSITLLAPGYSSGIFDVLDWDPAALAPDPTTVALRTQYFNPSALALSHVATYFTPPIVMRAAANVAEPPQTAIALDYRVVDPYNGQNAIYLPDGPADQLTGFSVQSGLRFGLSGAHPVFSYSVTEADPALEIVQSVRTTNGLVGTPWYDVMQRFRVPARTRLRWVELAFDVATPSGGLDPGTIAIMDAQGASVPPDALPATLVLANFFVSAPDEPYWASHYDFDHFITLQPDHDYWLYVQIVHDYALRARMKTGSEGPAFVAGIGPLFARAQFPGSWSPLIDRSLSFKLIGDQVDVTGVGLPAPSRASFALRVTPNPARGEVTIAWANARGAVRLEVLDPRGRRVARGEGARGGSGPWRWRGLDESGRALPAGVYFLKATDDAGRAASQRITLIR